MPLVELKKILNDLVNDSPHMSRPRLAPEVVVELPRSARLTTPKLKIPSDFSVVKAMVEDVAVAIMEAEDDCLQTLAEFTSSPSLKLLLHMSTNETCLGSFIRRVIVALPMPGVGGQGVGRHAPQAEIMVAWLLFG
jgi:hypothetical protein